MSTEDHLLRQIKNCVNFDFIYEKAAPYDSHMGRKSIIPVIYIKVCTFCQIRVSDLYKPWYNYVQIGMLEYN